LAHRDLPSESKHYAGGKDTPAFASPAGHILGLSLVFAATFVATVLITAALQPGTPAGAGLASATGWMWRAPSHAPAVTLPVAVAPRRLDTARVISPPAVTPPPEIAQPLGNAGHAVTSGPGVAAAPRQTSAPFAVQVAALGSAQAARDLQARLGHSDTTKAKQADIQKVELGGRTFYRVYLLGFSRQQDAASFCRVLKQNGQDCLTKPYPSRPGLR